MTFYFKRIIKDDLDKCKKLKFMKQSLEHKYPSVLCSNVAFVDTLIPSHLLQVNKDLIKKVL